MNALSVSSLQSYWLAPEVAANCVVFFNIAGALFLGLLVGYERSYRGRAAGMRTYGMVCMASCALTVIAGYPEMWFGGDTAHAVVRNVDPTRIIQGIVTGIGFLGAGVIMRDGLNISGLTTAASIWTVSAIGVLVGVGFYVAAILLSLSATVFMIWGAKLEALLPTRHAIAVTLHFHNESMPSDVDLQKLTRDMGYEIARGSFSISEQKGKPEWRFVVVSMGNRRGASLVELSRRFSASKEIESFHVQHARN
jgi:putative Mg2+ transporter-C (MgtC) family protein